jgi:hypothetical protein
MQVSVAGMPYASEHVADPNSPSLFHAATKTGTLHPTRKRSGGYEYDGYSIFPHRRNRDGTFNSICLTCLATIVSDMSEDELNLIFFNRFIPPGRQTPQSLWRLKILNLKLAIHSNVRLFAWFHSSSWAGVQDLPRVRVGRTSPHIPAGT